MAGNFVLDLTKFIAKANAAPGLVVKKACFDMFSRIVQLTPVDTGRAKAGWQVGVNTMPPGSDPGPVAKGGKAPAPKPINIPNIQSGDTLWLVNNVQYITVLEDGHSQQAPAGMVKTTITEFQSYIAKAVASL